MKRLMLPLLCTLLSLNAQAYSKFKTTGLFTKNYDCKVSNDKISDVTHASFFVLSRELKSTGAHVETTAEFRVDISYDPDYNPYGPQNLTKAASEFSDLDRFAGTDASNTINVDGKPVPTQMNIDYTNNQLNLRLQAELKVISPDTASLSMTYTSLYDAQKHFTVSGICKAWPNQN